VTANKPGVRGRYQAIREAFPDFHAVIHWQTGEGEIVTTFKNSSAPRRCVKPPGVFMKMALCEA
jgi:hypothetical protein